MTQTFDKPALSIEQQVEKLIAKGMVVNDRELVTHCLQHISYYRLSAYWFPFENPKPQEGGRFKETVTFENILALYEFDRKLRLLTLDAIERIEVAVRGSWAYQLAMIGGSHGYFSSELYSNPKKHEENCSKLKREAERSKDAFMAHYREKYGEPVHPPVWMASELLSFGQLSQWYASLVSPKTRNDIARPFGLDETIFVSFVHHLAVVRNICAHHGRLWNRSPTIALKLPKTQPELLANALNREQPRKIYNSFAMIQYVLQTVENQTDWASRLINLIDRIPIPLKNSMGFNENWKDRNLWS